MKDIIIINKKDTKEINLRRILPIFKEEIIADYSIKAAESLIKGGIKFNATIDSGETSYFFDGNNTIIVTRNYSAMVERCMKDGSCLADLLIECTEPITSHTAEEFLIFLKEEEE